MTAPSLFLTIPILLALAMPVLAQATPKDPVLVVTGTVREILRSDLLLLDDNKRYRLDNIRIPVDYSQFAADLLTAKLLNKKINVYTTHAAKDAADRYGLPLVHVMRADDGMWIQAELISQGLAWAFSSPSSRQMAISLKQKEAKARAEQKGFWANPAYAVKTPANVHNFIDSFQIVEGKIRTAKPGDGLTYFNFGQDWKKDFTLILPSQFRQAFQHGKYNTFDPALWEGKTVSIRGWVESKNGPMIELTHPEQMDFIEK